MNMTVVTILYVILRVIGKIRNQKAEIHIYIYIYIYIYITIFKIDR